MTQRKLLIHWCVWFFLGNVILCWLIGFHYFSTFSLADSFYAMVKSQIVLSLFVSISYIGQLGILALSPCILVIPSIFIFPQKQFIFFISITFAVLMVSWLILDTITYQLYRFHLNGLILALMMNGSCQEILALSKKEYEYALYVLLGLMGLEFLYAKGLWRYCIKNKKHSIQYQLIGGLLTVLYLSYLMIGFSEGRILHRYLLEEIRFLPFYTDLLGIIMPVKNGRTALQCISETYLLQPARLNVPLRYPLQPLVFKPVATLPNIVIIVIDAWRFDMLNEWVAPNLSQWARHAWVFTRHLSGGNATGPGIFSLFYSLPHTYWTSMEMQHRGPLFMNELLKRHYQMGIFGSATLAYPPFDKTVFADIKNLRLTTPGKNVYERDHQITENFKQFLAAAIKKPQPFFGFLFYDGVHSYCANDAVLQPFKPVIAACNRMFMTKETEPLLYLNRYKNAVLLVDHEISQVLDLLKSEQLLQNTIIIITGDHGEEFNDHHSGYWSHSSRFTRYQTETPLIVAIPGKPPHVFKHQTTHFDIVPTLMADIFHCETAFSKYSLGRHLLDNRPRPYFIINSYVATGIVEPTRITTVQPSGEVSIELPTGEPLPKTTLNLPVMRLVFQDLHRFFKM